MIKPPIVENSYRKLHLLAMGPLKSAFLNCAIDYNIFDYLNEPSTHEDIALKIGTHPDNTRRFLNALATIELLGKKDGLYKNLPISETFLDTKSPSYIGLLLKQVQHDGLNPLDKLSALLEKGPDSQESLTKSFTNEAVWAKEIENSAGWVLGGVGQTIASIVSKLPGFNAFEKMLDLGCGHGAFSIYILDKHKSLKSVLFDRAAVLKAAKHFVERWQLTDRLIYFPGDYLSDDLGDSYDLIFASSTLNFAIGNLDELLLKIYKALKPKGYFISLQDGMTNEYTKPDTMLGAIMPAMIMGTDYFFEQGEIVQMAINCGFQSVRSRTITTPVGEMDIDIARKG